MGMRCWLVQIFDSKRKAWHDYDEVYFTEDCDKEYVRRALINHDDYPVGIRVLTN